MLEENHSMPQITVPYSLVASDLLTEEMKLLQLSAKVNKP